MKCSIDSTVLSRTKKPDNALRHDVRRTLNSPRGWYTGVIASGLAGLIPAAIAAPFPPVLPLESLYPAGGGDGSSGFVVTGVHAYDGSGRAVSGAGDINGDGVNDLIIGARSADPRGRLDAGVSYVVFGSSEGFPAVIPLATLYPAGGGDGSRGFVLVGIAIPDASGYSVGAAGDINGDGMDDLIIGAPLAEAVDHSAAGESYVVFGSTEAFPAVFQLASLYPAGGGDGSRGFVLPGVDVSDCSGGSVSGAGDINGDGIDDLIVGAARAGPGGRSSAGESYVVFGAAQPFPAVFPLAALRPDAGGDGSQGFVLTGIGASDLSGGSVSAAGDVNGDGIDDLIISAVGANPGGRTSAGESYVVFGSTESFPAVFPLATLFPAGGGDGSHGFVLTGANAHDWSGRSVSAAGDFNGDGIDDIIVGASAADSGGRSDAGESYVIFGASQGFPPVLPLATLYPGGGGDGTRGFVLAGVQPYDYSGIAVSAAGDVNGDGMDDLIIGAYGANATGGDYDVGQSYVVFGSAQAFPAIFPLANLFPVRGGDGTRGFVLNGIDDYDRSARTVGAGGDINGDSMDDLIIGAYGASPEGRTLAGESYVIFGRSSTQ